MNNSFLKKNTNKLLLYTGLSLLLAAFVIRGFGGATSLWIPVFSLAIALKVTFLIVIFRTRQFKWSLWLSLILAGVALILISLIFKYVFPVTLLRNILFYGAIVLKISGLILLFSDKAIFPKKRSKMDESI